MGIDLERDTDPEVLRQVVALLEAENRRLLARVTELTRQLLVAQGRDRVALQMEIEQLQDLEKKNRMLFGQSSKRRAGEAGAEKEREPQRGHEPRDQKELRIVVEPHTLEDSARTCAACNGTLEEMGDVAGRKNHYGSRSRRGTEVAAVFYSLIESAKLAGVEPAAYLKAAAEAALADPNALPRLPHELAHENAAA